MDFNGAIIVSLEHSTIAQEKSGGDVITTAQGGPRFRLRCHMADERSPIGEYISRGIGDVFDC